MLLMIKKMRMMIRMIFNAIIEMPANTHYKYEYDKDSKLLVLDRRIPIAIPSNYGFIPNTLCDDGDPLDVFVVSKNPLVSLSKVKFNIISAFRCNDNGKSDDKILGILDGETAYGSFDRIESEYRVITYLNNYKKGFEIIETVTDKQAIEQIIEKARQLYG